jgi:methionine-rich copper-binding protein CopC
MLRHKLPLAGVTAALTLAIAVPATAHTEVKSTNPKRGSTATKSLKSVKVTFTGRIRSGTLRVKRVGGSKVSNGSGGRDPRNVKRLAVSLKSGLKSGRYKVNWTIVADDGHDQKGSFRFKIG